MKFSKPDQKVMQAFANLRSNPSFVAILEYLENCKRLSDDEMRHETDAHKLFWNNGGGQVVNEILRLYHASKQM